MLKKDERKLLVNNLKKILKEVVTLELAKIDASVAKKISKTIKSSANEISKEFVKKSHEEAKKLRKQEEKKNKKVVEDTVAMEDTY